MSAVFTNFMTSASFHFAGLVPEPESKMEEEGALRSDAAGPNSLLHRVRAATSNATRELRTGREGQLFKSQCRKTPKRGFCVGKLLQTKPFSLQ